MRIEENQQYQQQQQQQSKKMKSNKSKLSVITQPEAFYETAHELADKAASTVLGQYAIDKIDRILSTIEKTAKWSLPQSEQPTNAAKTSHSPILDRPLPWIPFLATIMALRAIRISLSFASILIGNEPISASSVVYFIQTRRRKLRYIKYNGLRNIRLRQEEAEKIQKSGFINKLNSVIGKLLCRPGGNHNENSDSYIRVALKKRGKSHKNKGRKKHKSNSKNNKPKDELSATGGTGAAAAAGGGSGENIPIEILKYLHDEGGDYYSDDDSDFTLEECTSETTTFSEDDDNEQQNQQDDGEKKIDQDELVNNKKLLEKLIQRKRAEFENEIKSRLESQNEEGIVYESCTKLDENVDKNQQQNNEEQHLQQQLYEKQQQQQQQYESQNQLYDNNDDGDNNHNINENNNNSSPENPSSVSINPLKLSSEIAQNGNIDDEKYENSQSTLHNFNKETKGHKKLSLTISSDSSSSSEDVFYSPDIQSEYERVFENHLSSVQDVIKQKEELNSIESTMPFIENEIKTNLQINLKPTSTVRKNHSSSSQSSSRTKSKK